jgi:long-subunit fatty acid transport protein
MTPNIEVGANYTSQMNVSAKGEAHAVNGPEVTLAGQPVAILPSGSPRCAAGGTQQALKGCVEFALPMTAQVGGRYKILDADGKERGDLEMDLNWEHWQAERASDFRVVVDAQATTEGSPNAGIDLKDNLVKHGLRDTWGLRLGGSYKIDAGSNTVIARGGFAYDTAAAKEGWERADIDGASRMMLSAGASYRFPSIQIDAGFGAILEGTRSTDRNCNPTMNPDPNATPRFTGCGPGDVQQAPEDRSGPDPINPLVLPEQQLENPTNQGTYKSHYLMFMLGVSTWF